MYFSIGFVIFSTSCVRTSVSLFDVDVGRRNLRHEHQKNAEMERIRALPCDLPLHRGSMLPLSEPLKTPSPNAFESCPVEVDNIIELRVSELKNRPLLFQSMDIYQVS